MRRPLCMACLLFLLLVRILLGLFPKPESAYEGAENTEVECSGTVDGKEEKNGRSIFMLKDRKTGRQLACYPEEGAPLPLIGSSVSVKGRLWLYKKASNPGQFDTAAYYLYRGVDGGVSVTVWRYTDKKTDVIRENIWRLRVLLCRVYDHILPAKDSGVMKAVVLGNKSELGSDVAELYRINGIAHILAISGLHISIIGMGLYRGLRKLTLPVTPSAVFAALLMIAYALLVGAGTSTVRAVTMFIIMCIADMERRSYDLPTALALSAASTVFFNPFELMLSGFWMSYMAVFGIAVFFPALVRGMERREGAVKKLRDAVLGGMSVSVFTLPLIIYNYYEIPLFSVLLNLIVLPLMGVLMVSGIVALPAGCIRLSAGMACAIPAHLVLGAYERLCGMIAHIPGHSLIVGRESTLQLVLSYIMLCSVVFLNRRVLAAAFGRGRFGKSMGFITDGKLIPLRLIICLLGISISFLRFKPPVRISYIDVGQGDGICIDSAEAVFMIDGGSSSEAELYKYTLAPFLKHEGIACVDYWFLTHPDADHISGLCELLADELCGICVKRIVLPQAHGAEEDFSEVTGPARKRGCEICFLSRGDKLSCGGLEFLCLHPPRDYECEDVNEYSQVLMLSCKGMSAVFTGDATAESEAEILKHCSLTSVDILKAGHHGSHTSDSPAWVERLKPRVCVISCGRNNRYGHPHAEVVERLTLAGSRICRTDRSGAVIVDLDRAGWKLHCFREDHKE